MIGDHLEEAHGWRVIRIPKRGFLAAVRAVLLHQPDVVHFEWIEKFILGRNLLVSAVKTTHFLAQICFLRWVARVPIVHTVHQLSSHGGVQPKYERAVNRIFVRMCSAIRTYSEAMKTEIVKAFGTDPSIIWVIRDIPYNRFYSARGSKSVAREQLEIGAEHFVYLAFGRVRRYKGLEELITAFRQCSHPEDRLIIAGPIDDRGYFEALTRLAAESSNVVLADGFVPVDDVHLYFEAADVCVYPFKRVGHSGSVDLAMGFGKPVVTLATKAHLELLAHQQHLLFADPGELPEVLQKAKRSDLARIGQLNLNIANDSNFEDFAAFLAKAAS